MSVETAFFEKTAIISDEKLNKPLYHGTSIHNLLGIISLNRFRSDLGDDELHQGVSLTESLGISRKFASESEIQTNMYSFSDDPWGEPDLPKRYGVVIVLNKKRLIAHIELSTAKWDGVSSEKEKRSHGDIVQAMNYIAAIRLKDTDLNWYLSAVDIYPDEFSNEYREALNWLVSSPILSGW